MNMSDEIKRLHELHQAGALSDAEFEQAKARLLGAAGSTDGVGDIGQLRRSRTDRWLGGVCGGLAKVSGMESWIWRLVFALFVLTFGFGIVIYLLMWIFVPEE
jgi:phage shock protein PspC (stress-responsive transcriptional regulator)